MLLSSVFLLNATKTLCFSVRKQQVLLHLFSFLPEVAKLLATNATLSAETTSRPFALLLKEGNIKIFGFAILAIFQIGFSVFVPKDFGFWVLVFIAVCGFFVF